MSETFDLTIADVTPALAAQWLTFNTHNRTLRPKVVEAYATDMRNGDWLLNGESIKFDTDGVLIDGQHRLAAVIAAGVTVRMVVVRGLPRAAQDTVDAGTKRKFADVLNLRGENHSSSKASITRKILLWKAGIRRNGGYQPTNTQLLQTFEEHPEIREIAPSAEVISRGCGMPPSVVGLAMWLCTRVESREDEDRAQLTKDVDFFFERLADGQSLAKGDALYELRRTVAESRRIRGERNQSYLLAITIKAWNAYRAGDKVGLLRYRPGGANPERFPEPR